MFFVSIFEVNMNPNIRFWISSLIWSVVNSLSRLSVIVQLTHIQVIQYNQTIHWFSFTNTHNYDDTPTTNLKMLPFSQIILILGILIFLNRRSSFHPQTIFFSPTDDLRAVLVHILLIHDHIYVHSPISISFFTNLDSHKPHLHWYWNIDMPPSTTNKNWCKKSVSWKLTILKTNSI